MEKKTIIETLDSVYINAGDLLDETINYLQTLQEEYKGKYDSIEFDIEYKHGYYNDTETLVLKGYRKETDEEFQARIDAEKQAIKKQQTKKEEKEYKEYLRLKKKYG